MPPKKRARYAAPAPALAPATSMAEVSKVQLKLRDWLQDVHALRHCTHGSGEDGDPTEVKGWPRVKPGTFRSIAQDVWSNKQKLLKRSLELLQKANLMPVGSTLEDLNTACTKLHVPPSLYFVSCNMFSMACTIRLYIN